jgi:hypothetical protein
MEKLIETRAAFPFLLRPGGTAMLCGLILFGMGAYVYRWDQLQKAGPAKDSLVRVQATLLAANCESTRSGSTVYGRPQVQYSYMYGGNTFKGDRYYSEWNLQLGTLPQCEAAMKQSFVQPPFSKLGPCPRTKRDAPALVFETESLGSQAWGRVASVPAL